MYFTWLPKRGVSGLLSFVFIHARALMWTASILGRQLLGMKLPAFKSQVLPISDTKMVACRAKLTSLQAHRQCLFQYRLMNVLGPKEKCFTRQIKKEWLLWQKTKYTRAAIAITSTTECTSRADAVFIQQQWHTCKNNTYTSQHPCVVFWDIHWHPIACSFTSTSPVVYQEENSGMEIWTIQNS